MRRRRENNSYVKAAKTMKKEKAAKQKKSPVFAADHKGRFGRFIGRTVGILCIGIGLLTLIVMSIRSHHYGMNWSFTHYFYLFICVAGVLLCLHTVRAENQMTRFRYYRSFMEGKEYMLLSEIADITGRKISFLQKDISRMSREKLFLQANMNREGTCLFLTKDAFKRYQRGQLILTADSESEMPKEEAQETRKEGEGSDTKKDICQNFSARKKRQAVQKEEQTAEFQTVNQKEVQPDWEHELHSINAMLTRINNYDIVNPVSDICIRGQQIIYFKDTTMKDEVARFLNYYLPIVKSTLSTCLELEKEGMEEQASDLQIIINTIQHSFDSFVEKLIEGKRVDVEEDIASMDMMLSNLSQNG